VAISLLPGRTDNLAVLPCRPTTYHPTTNVTLEYGRHIFLSGELGAACKCGRYHITEAGYPPKTDMANREVETIVVGGAA
jgi:hypothetical protein